MSAVIKVPPRPKLDLINTPALVRERAGGHTTPGTWSDSPDKTLNAVSLKDIKAKPVKWLWETDGAGRIPAQAVTLIAGREGGGKSSFTLWLSAHLTRGTLPGATYGTPNNVLLIASEDNPAYTIKPRALAVNVDLDRLLILNNRITLPKDTPTLAGVVEQNNISVIVLDPLTSVFPYGANANNGSEVRPIIESLIALCNDTGVSVLVVGHLNKGGNGATDIASRVAGSGEFKNVVRAVIALGSDGEHNALSQAKNSLGRKDISHLAYQLVSTPVVLDGVTTEVARFEITGESDFSAEYLLNALETGITSQSEYTQAHRFIVEELKKAGGEMLASEIYTKGSELGYSQKHLQRARANKKLTPHVHLSKRKYSYWTLNAPETPNSKALTTEPMF